MSEDRYHFGVEHVEATIAALVKSVEARPGRTRGRFRDNPKNMIRAGAATGTTSRRMDCPRVHCSQSLRPP